MRFLPPIRPNAIAVQLVIPGFLRGAIKINYQIMLRGLGIGSQALFLRFGVFHVECYHVVTKERSIT